MSKSIKQLFCRHRFNGYSCETFTSANGKRIAIIETCIKCGKQFGFSTNIRNFGLRDELRGTKWANM